jgi:peptidoglycan/xylan/chitin deacetylase (PgdA/CDA1 family)
MLTSHEVAAVAGLTLAAAVGATAYATINPRSQIFGPMLVAPPNANQLALTFDDGPNPTATPQLLDVLARHKARATFFLIGAHALKEPAMVREIAAAGHAIGNHTMTHPWLPRLSAQHIRQQLAECNKALEDTLGKRIELFRAPHGARKPSVLRAARDLGLIAVGWNLIVGDWNVLPATTLFERMQRGMARNHANGRGTNIVMHDGGQHTLTAPRLPTVEAVALLLQKLPAETVFVTPPKWHSS